MVGDRSISSRLIGLVVHSVILIIIITTIFPVLNILSNSVSDSYNINAGNVSFFPVGFSLEHFALLISDPLIPRSFLNSIIISVMGTAISLALTATMAYPLSRRRLPFRRFFIVMIVITMFFGGGLIPTFMVVRGLGMYDTYWALTIPSAISAFNLIIMRTFFKQVPIEMEESAFLDGASEVTVLVKIMIPLAKAGMATIALFYAVGYWNSFFTALIYLFTAKKYPMQLVLRDIVMKTEMNRLQQVYDYISDQKEIEAISIQGLKYALISLTVLPMLLVYPFIQKYFVKGAMIGSLKD